MYTFSEARFWSLNEDEITVNDINKLAGYKIFYQSREETCILTGYEDIIGTSELLSLDQLYEDKNYMSLKENDESLEEMQWID